MSLDDDNPPEKNAEVGYRKPPVHSRFRKGHSGNPKGRLRHDDPERVSSLFWREAGRLLTIREGDKTTKMPALRAVVRSQVASAVKGNVAAQRALVATARELAGDSHSRRSGRVADAQLTKNLDEMSDEEVMAFLRSPAK